MRSGRKSASQTPAPLKDRIYGSKKNKEGSASSDKSAKSIILSAETLIGLKNKLKEFKEKHPNTDNITLNDLKAVYRRGLGAYSSTHRPTISGGVPNTRNAWAMARVNKFLLKAGGTKVKKAYVQDDDLIKYDEGGITYREYLDTQFNEEEDRYLPSGYLNDSDIGLGIKDNYPILYLIKNGLEYRLKNEKDSVIGVFYLNKQVAYADNKAIIVTSNYQKRGIGLELVSILKERNPNHRFGSMTPEGFNLLGKYYDEKIAKKYSNGGNLKYNNMFETIGRLIRPNTLQQISKDHNVDMGFLQKQFEIGTKEEMEHTFDTETAETIALHHLSEDPQYYIKLKEMMLRTEAEKLDDYYANGGQVLSQAKCEVLDKNGERQIDPISIAKLTECVNNLPQTKFMHYDLENDKYKDYRTRLHKEIIYDIKKNVVCVESKNEPIAILMGGSPASGKSTFLKKYAEYLLQDEILKIDADEVRSKLPEYKGYNASQTHLETKDIVTTLLSNRNIGIPCLFDVIYDGTMNNTKSYLPLISLLKSLGYKVFMVYIDNVPKEVAIERSLQRYKKSGRFVPIEVIEDFFDKGKSAMEQIKKEVDGYMIVDGGNSNYDIIEQGGIKLPQNREYSKIGSPIEITEDEVVREFKKGGEVDPDNTEIKEMVTHKSGEVGGLLVGNRHSEGGIKAVNKSTGQPLEMEGGEVVITRNAVSDTKKRMFEGEMLTNREILSRINEGGGGVSFEEGGKVEDDDCGCNHKMKKGGDLLEDTLKAPKRVTDKINEMFADKFQFEFENGGQVYTKEELIRIVNKQVPSFVAYKNHKKPDPIKDKLEYKNYLYNVYDVRFEELPQMIQMGLLVGSQTIVDNYLNKK